MYDVATPLIVGPPLSVFYNRQPSFNPVLVFFPPFFLQ